MDIECQCGHDSYREAELSPPVVSRYLWATPGAQRLVRPTPNSCGRSTNTAGRFVIASRFLIVPERLHVHDTGVYIEKAFEYSRASKTARITVHSPLELAWLRSVSQGV